MEKRIPTTVKILFVCASLVIILAGVKAASGIVVPFLLSIFIAMACHPIINWTTRYKVPKGISILLVILFIIVFGFMFAGLVGQSMNEFSQKMPEYKVQLTKEFTWLLTQLQNFNIEIDSEQLLSYLDPAMAMNVATNLLSSLSGVLGNFLLILLTVIFMLFEADTVPKKVHIALDDPTMRLAQVDKVLASVKNYLVIKTVVSLWTGLLAGSMLWLLGVDHFVLWGVLAFLFNYVPNIGSAIAAIPAVLLAFIQLGSATAGIVGVGYIVINTVMGNIVEPRYMGKGLGLSTLVVFLSLIFWGWLLGTVGMLLSVPLTMIVKIILESNTDTRWIAMLLAGGDINADELPTRQEAEQLAAPKQK